ncbi:hypothetical protein AMJ40_04720 [candidate division TA06 bacterium DG_26]|uniref:Ribosomal RNA small subunit methyltransferase H n=1 Tax=candidate division TA06 bacterium DG_26 TaxID=1703771 RepID=A0A0S7WI26_UNCT6|nr:MAG: hypothetical protein AMJ40_04720 [candidate division TA06 bacterium DG_26]
MHVDFHTPVMVEEVLAGLDCQPGDTVVDATLGSGGHALAILNRIGQSGLLIGIDKDENAIALASKRLHAFKNVTIHRMDWRGMEGSLNVKADGFLMDVGLASFQIEDASRGFSYALDGPLDMRFDQQSPITAVALVNDLSERELGDILRSYGEEKYAKRIARDIIRERARQPIERTSHLARIVRGAVRGNPKKSLARCFQAFRIAVNGELDALRTAVEYGIQILRPKGRICTITYHSLEDRIVKTLFREADNSILNVLTRKPLTPSRHEVMENPKARSAKLRTAEKKDG